MPQKTTIHPPLNTVEAFVATVRKTIFDELTQLPSHRPLDDLDFELYEESCAGISNLEQLRDIQRAMRKTCRFRPSVVEFRDIVVTVIPSLNTEGLFPYIVRTPEQDAMLDRHYASQNALSSSVPLRLIESAGDES